MTSERDMKLATDYLDQRFVFIGTEQEKLTKAFCAGRESLRNEMRLTEDEQKVINFYSVKSDGESHSLLSIISRLTSVAELGE